MMPNKNVFRPCTSLSVKKHIYKMFYYYLGSMENMQGCLCTIQCADMFFLLVLLFLATYFMFII